MGTAFALMLALTFSNWIPTPPAMIGVVGAVTVVVLAPFGVAPAQALALGTVLNVVVVAPSVLLGIWATWARLLRLPGILDGCIRRWGWRLLNRVIRLRDDPPSEPAI